MNIAPCNVEGELEISTPDGPIRCSGMGNSIEVVFQNLRQLVKTSGPIRSGLAGPVANWLLSAAGYADIDVKLRIGERIIGDVCYVSGQDRPLVKLRFLNLAAAAVSRS